MSTVDIQEIRQFAKDSGHWWDENGPFAPLHRMNPTRMRYILEQAQAHFGLDSKSLKPFQGLKLLDIGCGGGLVCEPLARLGGAVTGIDADNNAVAVAKDHAKEAGLDIIYEATTSDHMVSSLRKQGPSSSNEPDSCLRRNDNQGGYDIVLALEIIEHVADIDFFVKSCVDLCRPGGLLIFSTLNRTPKSFALGIVAAEYILRWVPRGTHNWKKFIKPSELSRSLRSHGATPKDISGLIYNPVHGGFTLSANDVAVNYFLSAAKVI